MMCLEFAMMVANALVILFQKKLSFQPQTFTLAKNEGNISFRQKLDHGGVDDMTQLEDLHEASVLWNLRYRYDVSQFYTYVGSILISVNPYTMHPGLYGLEMAKKYAGAVLGILKSFGYYISQLTIFAFVFFRSTSTTSFRHWTSCLLNSYQSKTKSNDSCQW